MSSAGRIVSINTSIPGWVSHGCCFLKLSTMKKRFPSALQVTMAHFWWVNSNSIAGSVTETAGWRKELQVCSREQLTVLSSTSTIQSTIYLWTNDSHPINSWHKLVEVTLETADGSWPLDSSSLTLQLPLISSWGHGNTPEHCRLWPPVTHLCNFSRSYLCHFSDDDWKPEAKLLSQPQK